VRGGVWVGVGVVLRKWTTLLSLVCQNGKDGVGGNGLSGWRVTMGSVKFVKRIKEEKSGGDCLSFAWVECKKGQERWPTCGAWGGLYREFI